MGYPRRPRKWYWLREASINTYENIEWGSGVAGGKGKIEVYGLCGQGGGRGEWGNGGGWEDVLGNWGRIEFVLV